ncbi:MAG: acyl carrier protein [Chloroflexota bacterium]
MTNTQTLTEYISTTFIADHSKQLAPDDNLLISGLIDSLGVMQLVAHLQAENNIKIEPRDITLKNFKTVNSIVDFVASKRA